MIATLHPSILDLRVSWSIAEQRAEGARIAARLQPCFDARRQRAETRRSADAAWQRYCAAGGSLEDDTE
jgi:hypothetical protein